MQSDKELMQQALEALDDVLQLSAEHSKVRTALRERLADTTHTCSYHCERPECVRAQRDELRERLARQEQKADVHLFYAPGDVLVCKESYERVVVKHGNTGPLQLANGKIALEWSDETYGEYTLEQIMDGFILEGSAPQEPTRAEKMRDAGYTRRPTLREFSSDEPARQEQEPVAWMVKAHGSAQKFVVRADVADELACKWRESDPDADALPLYTAPPAREWVRLTEGEIVQIAATPAAIPGSYVHSFARAIEAKLREKNHV